MSDYLTAYAISMELLVHGYIREHEILLINKYIPITLKNIIVKYYASTYIAFHFNKREPKCVSITNVHHRTSTTNCKAQVISLNSVSDPDISMTFEEISSTITYSMTVPPAILNKIRKYKKYLTNEYQAGFTTNSGCPTLYLMHKNDIKHNKCKDNAPAYKWNLPASKYKSKYDHITYDNGYGLIKLNGWRLDLSYISFKSNDPKGLQWQKFDISTETTYGSWRREGAMVIIITDDNKKVLFVCGGANISVCHMYNFESNTLTSNKGNFKAMDAGICYDNIKQNIYVGGGNVNGNHCQVRSYDLMKNEWYSLPDTCLKHENKPIMWTDQCNRDILYIGSNYQNDLECIDLRAPTKGWTLV